MGLVLSPVDYVMAYCPRSQNTKADKLFRIHPREDEKSEPESILPDTCWMRAIEWDFDNEITNTLSYHIPEECSHDCMYVPHRLRSKLISWEHSTPAPGHHGIVRTLAFIQGKYRWQNMSQGLNNHVVSCSTYEQMKVPHHFPVGKLMPLPTPQCPSSHIAKDSTTDLPVLISFDKLLIRRKCTQSRNQ